MGPADTTVDGYARYAPGVLKKSWDASCSLHSHKGAGMAVGAVGLADHCGPRSATAQLFPSLHPVSLGLLHSLCDRDRDYVISAWGHRLREGQLLVLATREECLGRRSCWHGCLLSFPCLSPSQAEEDWLCVSGRPSPSCDSVWGSLPAVLGGGWAAGPARMHLAHLAWRQIVASCKATSAWIRLAPGPMGTSLVAGW